jgi:hypothetical protein
MRPLTPPRHGIAAENSSLVLGLGVTGGRDTGYVFCLDAQGNERWRKNMWELPPYVAHSKAVRIEQLLAEDFDGDGASELVVVANDLHWLGGHIILLDPDQA